MQKSCRFDWLLWILFALSSPCLKTYIIVNKYAPGVINLVPLGKTVSVQDMLSTAMSRI